MRATPRLASAAATIVTIAPAASSMNSASRFNSSKLRGAGIGIARAMRGA
jgi:hypothetical protein